VKESFRVCNDNTWSQSRVSSSFVGEEDSADSSLCNHKEIISMRIYWFVFVVFVSGVLRLFFQLHAVKSKKPHHEHRSS